VLFDVKDDAVGAEFCTVVDAETGGPVTSPSAGVATQVIRSPRW
jgi:hypothetical protein